MKCFFINFLNAIKVFFIAFSNPKLLTKDALILWGGIMQTINSAMDSGLPYMSQIGIVHTENRKVIPDFRVATVWVGVGENSNPLDRITELVKENQELKKELAQFRDESWFKG